jgi:LysR family transcriptional activator of nhaA
MEWMNYHHLLYFWLVAREGSVKRASELLNLTQPTISNQLRMLEESLGEKLFARSGRRLVLTEVGQAVYAYADEIFTIGRELQDMLRGRPTGRPVRLTVGLADVVPKLVAFRLLEAALHLPEPVRIICHEDNAERLLARLVAHELDIVLADSPIGASAKVRAFNHLLGESAVSVFAEPALGARYREGFPGSLDGAPFLLPTEGTALRRSLEQWFDAQDIRPRVVGEFDDAALLVLFGQNGEGPFCAPSIVAAEVRKRYQVRQLGQLEAVRERFYAISTERRLKNPAIVAITEMARHKLFSQKRKQT